MHGSKVMAAVAAGALAVALGAGAARCAIAPIAEGGQQPPSRRRESPRRRRADAATGRAPRAASPRLEHRMDGRRRRDGKRSIVEGRLRRATAASARLVTSRCEELRGRGLRPGHRPPRRTMPRGPVRRPGRGDGGADARLDGRLSCATYVPEGASRGRSVGVTGVRPPSSTRRWGDAADRGRLAKAQRCRPHATSPPGTGRCGSTIAGNASRPRSRSTTPPRRSSR